MCLGLPGRVVHIEEGGLFPLGKADFDGVVQDVCLSYVPGVAVGDYVIVHAGFAIAQLDESAANQMIALLAELEVAQAET